jgi:hypothetical protein
MTTAELAQALSISVDKLGSYETGVDRLPSSLLVRVCDLLQITPISLFQRKGARWH